VGDQQDYGHRIYDPRVGRFLSVDPVTGKYPELTPYQFASDRPIDGVDQDGLEYEEMIDQATEYLSNTWEETIQPALPAIGAAIAASWVGFKYEAQQINWTPWRTNQQPVHPQPLVPSAPNQAQKISPPPGYQATPNTPAPTSPSQAHQNNAPSSPTSTKPHPQTVVQISKAKTPVQPFEFGPYNELKSRSQPGDNLDIHHVPQGQPAGQVIPNYDYPTGTAIALPRDIHQQIPNQKGPYTGTASDLLNLDSLNLKDAGVPDKAIQGVVDLAKQTYGIL